MKKLTHCPFCNDPVVVDRPYTECCSGKDDHTYIQVFSSMSDEINRIKLRVGPGAVRYYLDTYIDEDYSLVWSGRNDTRSKVTIEKKISLDFSKGIDGIKQQIKMYLTFS